MNLARAQLNNDERASTGWPHTAAGSKENTRLKRQQLMGCRF
jgi:hypothetical protein